MAETIVVQGTPVANPHVASSSSPGTGVTPDQMPHGGEKVESGCKDPIFAGLFYANIIAILVVAVYYGPTAFEDSTAQHNYRNFVWGVVVIVLVSFAGAGGGLFVMMCCPETLIKISLLFTLAMSAVWMILAFLAGAIGVGVIAAIFFVINCCYAYAVWSRIPFASINLVTAITAVKANLGLAFYAYVITAIAGLWSICWSVAFVGVFDRTYQCDADNVCTDPNYGLLFLLFLAFFFGHQVFQYSIHCIVAGTVGTWWYSPEECGCCSSAVNNSFLRTYTTSFGSICFGGFVVAVIQALRMLANTAQAEGEGNCLACIAECILACLASIVEYINKWAFIYVGIYGFGYIQSAKSVFQLFANRGWEAIIADDLVANTLLLVSLVVGAVMGGISMIIQKSTGLYDEVGSDRDAMIYAFVVGFVVGLTITSILMSVIGSGVNAVIVLFAEAPAEFQQNYPDLSNKMRTIWNQVYPGSV